MTEPDPLLFPLQQMVIDLALIDRHHHLAKTDRRENDIEHSFSVTLLCWFIHDRYDIKLDIGKILKHALAHDFVERYAGDTNTFASQKDRGKKIKLEKESLNRLNLEFSEFKDLVNTMNQYETKKDEESLFVWTVDKMQALLMGDMDGWRPYQEMAIDFKSFSKKYAELLIVSSSYCKEIFEGLIEYCKSTYYDRPL